MKSFKFKGGSDEPPASGRNAEVDFRGKPHGNETHASTTTPMRGSTRRQQERPPGCATWVMC